MHTLPKLNYDFSALEPHIDTTTMQIHYGKHHQTYVDKLNAALQGVPEWMDKDIVELLKNLDKLPEAVRTPVRNMGGGHYNHTLFWESLSPKSAGPSDTLKSAVMDSFGSWEKMVEDFTTKSTTLFGSGWVWLVQDSEKKLSIVTTPNQDNPVMTSDARVLLGLDLWEHAYYLKYQNRRPEYITAWWNLVNWDVVDSRMA